VNVEEFGSLTEAQAGTLDPSPMLAEPLRAL
jgi:hypothetical protein